jgi:hypothetical protein
MNRVKGIVIVCALAAGLGLPAGTASAQVRGRAGHGPVVGHAVSRGFGPRGFGGGRPIFVSPRIVRVAPYRPYFYPFRPGLRFGFYASFGYPYYYGYPYPVYSYPYGYYPYAAGYGYGGYGYSGYGYGGSGGYGYPMPPPSYVSMRPGAAYGGVRIEGAPRDAQVFADGYYMGIVDDFDGTFQHLNLEAGVHQIEIRAAGQPPISFQVNVQPGQTITYHAGIQ